MSQPNLQIYILAMYFSKLSNLFFTRRITPPKMRRIHRVIYSYFAFHTVWTLAAGFLLLFACTPVSSNWNMTVRLQGVKCLNMRYLAISTTVLFVLSDVAFLALSFVVVWNLKLPNRAKIGVCFLFLLGALACVACVVKITYFVNLYLTWDSTCMSASCKIPFF
jgi:hypothetical protein